MATRKVFISYRRDDARADAGRLYDRLHARYPDRVFRDVGSLEPGVDWKQAVDGVLQATDACIVVIGPRWLTITDEEGKRRIDDRNDPVRREIARALAAGLRVFPVLVGDARMPEEDDLPADLQPLATRNALELSEQDFDAAFDKLVKALERMPGWAAEERLLARVPIPAVGAAVAALLVIVAAIVFFRGDPTPGDAAAVPAETRGGSNPTPAAAPPVAAAPTIAQEPAVDSAAGADGSVGQIRFEWRGVTATSFQVYDAAKRKVLRYASTGASGTEVIDIAPGQYVVVMDNKPEIPPIPVTVAGGRAAAVNPRVGQVTLDWKGANATGWQVYDKAKRNVLRYGATAPGRRDTFDVAPGEYLVVMDKPEMPSFPVTIAADQNTIVTPTVGQLTFSWGGVNAVTWQVTDASGRSVLRYESTGAGQTRTIDMAPGRYRVVLSNNPEFEPIAVTVTADQETRVPFGGRRD